MFIACNPYRYQLIQSSILNVAEFLDQSLEASPCRKTSSVSCKNQPFFLQFRNAATFIENNCVFLCYFLRYDKAFLISLLDGCDHTVLMDPANGCSISNYL